MCARSFRGFAAHRGIGADSIDSGAASSLSFFDMCVRAVQGDMVAAEYLLLALFCRRPVSSTTSTFSRLQLNLITGSMLSETPSNSKTRDKALKQEKGGDAAGDVRLAALENGGCISTCGGSVSCACVFSKASAQVMSTLEALVPRLVGVSVRPAALATANLAPKLLLEDETEEETRMGKCLSDTFVACRVMYTEVESAYIVKPD